MTRKSLEISLEKAVTCSIDGLNTFNGSSFDGGPNDVKMKLEKLGVKVNEESQHGGEIRYLFPVDVKVFGYQAIEAIFSSPSTTIFFITLHANSSSLVNINKILKLHSLPSTDVGGYGYFNEFKALYIRKLSVDKESPPDTIFSGILNQGSNIVVGCQNLSW